ncbi:hypothetical protein BH20GEM1_BH20GEM1_19490 [soil metagenome]
MLFGPTVPRIAPYRDTEAGEARSRRSYNRHARDFCVVRKVSHVAILTSTLLPGSKHPRGKRRAIP